VTGTSPKMYQHQLGRRLRELRTQHGLTVEDVGGKLLCSAVAPCRAPERSPWNHADLNLAGWRINAGSTSSPTNGTVLSNASNELGCGSFEVS
jgi:hypothetical protein